jgi:hypothetical protein
MQPKPRVQPDGLYRSVGAPKNFGRFIVSATGKELQFDNPQRSRIYATQPA